MGSLIAEYLEWADYVFISAMNIQSWRGCPFDCEFCNIASLFWPRPPPALNSNDTDIQIEVPAICVQEPRCLRRVGSPPSRM